MSAHRIYDADSLTKIGSLFNDLVRACDSFEPGFGDGGASRDDDDPLYINELKVVVKHKGGYAVATIGLDNFPYVEFGGDE